MLLRHEFNLSRKTSSTISVSLKKSLMYWYSHVCQKSLALLTFDIVNDDDIWNEMNVAWETLCFVFLFVKSGCASDGSDTDGSTSTEFPRIIYLCNVVHDVDEFYTWPYNLQLMQRSYVAQSVSPRQSTLRIIIHPRATYGPASQRREITSLSR